MDRTRALELALTLYRADDEAPSAQTVIEAAAAFLSFVHPDLSGEVPAENTEKAADVKRPRGRPPKAAASAETAAPTATSATMSTTPAAVAQAIAAAEQPQAAQSVATTPSPPQAATATTATPSVTKEVVGLAMIDLIKAGRRNWVVKILADNHAESISGMDPARYSAAHAAALEAIKAPTDYVAA
jgi:hypothetical protein